MAEAKYFRFDDELWEEGRFLHCAAEGGLCIAPEGTASGAIYLSPLLDSGVRETCWHRLRLRVEGMGDGRVSFACFAIDDDAFALADGISIQRLCAKRLLAMEDALALLAPLWTIKSDGASDLPLFSVQGRYLLFKIEIHVYDGGQPRIGELRIDFPLHTIAKKLPEFYQDDRQSFDFIRRYLGIFQSLAEDLQEEIVAFPARLDAAAAQEDFLLWLASAWAGIDEPLLWPEQRLRRLVNRSFALYAAKGTREGLCDVIELFISARPRVIETNALLCACERGLYDQIYRPLLGGDRCAFFLLVEQRDIERRQIEPLGRIVEHYKPAHTQANLVVLMPFMVLGGHSYLGVNSVLSSSQRFTLDGHATLPFHTMILK